VGPGLSGMIAVNVIAIISAWSVVPYMNIVSPKRLVSFVIYGYVRGLLDVVSSLALSLSLSLD
jgi:hypothetical protein